MAMPQSVKNDRAERLVAPGLRSDLERFVRGRVPAHDVDDVVQATLTDALAAARAPEDAEELRRWVFGIAKNKVADLHRKGSREVPRELGPGEEAAAESVPHSARDLLRWAEKELPEAEGSKSTLEWMLREGDGEKLEHIADEEQLPAARVRQRVSRLRRHFRSRWAAQLAAAAALVALALAVWAIWRGRATPGPEDIAQEKPRVPSPEERADEMRRAALERCAARDWQRCLDELERAKAIDPKGDEAEAVQEARAAAGRGLGPSPEPSLAPAPSTSGAPPKPRPPPPDIKGQPLPNKGDPKPSEPPPDEKKMAPPKVAPEKGNESLLPAPQLEQLKGQPQQAPPPPPAAKKKTDFSAGGKK